MHRLLQWCSIVALALATGGCIVPGLSSFVVRLDPSLHSVTFQTSATHAACAITARSGAHLRHDCNYRIATADKLARVFLQDVGTVEPLVDPVILQVPASATSISGNWTDGVVTGLLTITPVAAELPADLTRKLVPEAGHKLVIVDFPKPTPPLDGRKYSFGLVFVVRDVAMPVTIKAVFAAKVTANNETYYPPLFPCATTFASIPGVQVRESTAYVQVDLAAVLAASACSESFYTFAPIVPETVNVIEFHHAGFDHYFVSWLPDEIAELDAGTRIRGWKRTGHQFKAFATAQPGSSPVCRFYIPPGYGDSHFYGRGAVECDATAANLPHLILEAREFMYVTLPTLAGDCPGGGTVVYRVFSNRPDANHRYMTDRKLRDEMAAKGWLPEGDGTDLVVMCTPF